MSPNFNEMIQYVKAFNPDSDPSNLNFDFSGDVVPEVLTNSPIFKMAEKLLSKIKSDDGYFFVTLGPLGTVAFEKSDSKIQYQIVPPPFIGESEKVVSVSGAGDS